jgi:hypothetical protein
MLVTVETDIALLDIELLLEAHSQYYLKYLLSQTLYQLNTVCSQHNVLSKQEIFRSFQKIPSTAKQHRTPLNNKKQYETALA